MIVNFVLIMFIVLVVAGVCFLSKFHSQRQRRQQQTSDLMNATNRFKLIYQPVSPQLPTEMLFYCINLSFRPEKFARVQNMFSKQGLELRLFEAIHGQNLRLDLFDDRFLNKWYKQFLQKNKNQRGHLGCTFSHLGLLQLIVDCDLGQTCIVEDDILIESNFKSQLEDVVQRMNNVDPNWDILHLGFSCNYQDYVRCHENDNIELQAQKIAKLGYAIGLFGYVVNGARGARNILNNVFPISWHIDHFLSNLNQQHRINMYGAIPNIVFHPGTTKISSFNEIYVQSLAGYKSDSNGVSF